MIVAFRGTIEAPEGPSDSGYDQARQLLHQGIEVVFRADGAGAITVLGRRGGISGWFDRLRASARDHLSLGPRRPGERGPAGSGHGRHRRHRRGLAECVPAVRHRAHALGQRAARGQPRGHHDRSGQAAGRRPMGRLSAGGAVGAAHDPVRGGVAAHHQVGGHDRRRSCRVAGWEGAGTSGRSLALPRAWSLR